MLCQSDLFFSVKSADRLPYQSADHVDQLVAAKPGEAGPVLSGHLPGGLLASSTVRLELPASLF